MPDSIGNLEHGRSDSSVVVAIVRAVAGRRGVEPTELQPLYDWVDPVALERLFDPSSCGATRKQRYVFDYLGHTVGVERNDDDFVISVDGSTTELSTAIDSSDESCSDA